MPPTYISRLTATILAALVYASSSFGVNAMSTIDFLTSLSDSEIAEFQAWRDANRSHQRRLDAYWDEVEAKRQARRKRRKLSTRFSESDYVMRFPPKYDGPSVSASLKRKYLNFLKTNEKQDDKSDKDKSTLPRLSDFLAAARAHYGFVPERVSEAEFKLRYAEEARALGLSKDQVVRVYALETGGIGTYDMQAGIHPIRKTGRPISTALGYAQLLNANSISEFHKHGRKFIARVQQRARSSWLTPKQRRRKQMKIAALKKMYATVRRLPFNWSKHVRFARTSLGRGIHALNVDSDIGPMLQAHKLLEVSEIAARAGMKNLSGAELEIMNLSGPGNGLEMMRDAGRRAPTSNFFSRQAYYVNKMAVNLTGEGLLAELNRRMDMAVKTKGSRQFSAAFDRVGRQSSLP